MTQDMQPLLTEPDAPAPPARAPARTFRERLNAPGDAFARRWSSRPGFRKGVIAAGVVLLLAGGVSTWLALRPVPQPDYASADIDEVFNFTLLTNEFNDLPVETRLDLIGQLVDRLRGMDGEESAMMAAFAAGIIGAAREQLMENASRLMYDTVDMYATDYRTVSDADRGAFIDDATVELMRLRELFSGSTGEESDEELLRQARDQAQRDQEFMRQNPLSGRQVGGMLTFMGGETSQHVSPVQEARVTVFFRDMVRRLRDEPLQK